VSVEVTVRDIWHPHMYITISWDYFFTVYLHFCAESLYRYHFWVRVLPRPTGVRVC